MRNTKSRLQAAEAGEGDNGACLSVLRPRWGPDEIEIKGTREAGPRPQQAHTNSTVTEGSLLVHMYLPFELKICSRLEK